MVDFRLKGERGGLEGVCWREGQESFETAALEKIVILAKE